MKPKGKFTVQPFTNPYGSQAFRVTGTTRDGRRIRKNYSSEAEALGEKQRLELADRNVDLDSRLKPTILDMEQLREAERAFAELAGVSLTAAARFHLEHYREPITKISTREAVDQFLKEKQAANVRSDTLRNLRGRLYTLKLELGEVPVSDIQPDALRSLIFRPGNSPRTRKNNMLALSNFLNWAVTRGYSTENTVKKLGAIKVEETDPQILTLPEVRRLLSVASQYRDGCMVPFFAIATFAALRPSEIHRLTWEDIDLKEKTITLSGKKTKMRKRRIVSISDNLVAWLKPYSLNQGPIHWTRRHEVIVRRLAGFGNPTPEEPELKPWVQDYLRHTAISHHLARHQHEGQTAAWAGNSPNIIQKHYKGLVRQSDTASFWAIKPTKKGRKPRNITAMPQAASQAA